MASRQPTKVIQQLCRSLLVREEAGLTDGQLLERFVARRDEAAFEALLRRHGPMVLGVCRRVLRSPHDAEDAFQATFLVLVRKAGSVAPREKVGNWLYGVAYQTARRVRGATAKRQTREKQVTEMPEPAVAPPDLGHDLQALLDQELSRLPDRYRVPIVLCDLGGKTRKEAARQLGWPEGTVSGRLARGRKKLADRLARRGLVLSAGALAAVVSQSATSACLPSSLMLATIQAAVAWAAGSTAAAGVISTEVAGLTEGVLKTMFLNKLKVLTGVLLALGVLGAGIGASSRIHPMQTEGPREVHRETQLKGQAEAKNPVGRAAELLEKNNLAGVGELQATRDARIQELLKERLATLKELAKQVERECQIGNASFEQVAQAQGSVLKAELELADSARERLAIHVKMVALAKESEKTVGELYRAGKAKPVDLLRARANRLEAEIALERAKAQATAPPQ